MPLPSEFALDFTPRESAKFTTWSEARYAARLTGKSLWVTVAEPCDCCLPGVNRNHKVYCSGRVIALPY